MKLIAVITVLGTWLRLSGLGLAPFWIDEAFFAVGPAAGLVNQEQLPALVAQILGVGDEFRTRLPFAIAGVLTIPAIYIAKPSKTTLGLALLVAVCPLFVLHSRMCRPYAMAGLFIVLSWRWRWAALAAILCTPTAIIGINAIEGWKHKWTTLALILLAFGILFLRTDLSREGFFTWQMFSASPRLWVVPALALGLYIVTYLIPRLKLRTRRATVPLVIGLSLFFFIESVPLMSLKAGPPFNPWYSSPLLYNDWRGMPPVDMATNFRQITEYYTGKQAVLLRMVGTSPEPEAIKRILATKDTILVGVDCYANHLSRWFFPDQFIGAYGRRLYEGKVLLVRMTRASKGWEFKVIPTKQ